MYKDPKTRRKVSVVSPAMSLGTAVHEVVEGLGKFKTEDRFKTPADLFERFEKAWSKISGRKGGFRTEEEEAEAKARGHAMIKRVIDHPGPLLLKTVKFGSDNPNDMLPHFFLSEEENIILCGKIDWLIYKPEDDSLDILDFKTGKNEEKSDSFQLPIYQLLLKNLQKRKVTGAQYWYLDKDDAPVTMPLPDMEKSLADIMSVARAIKKARTEAAAAGKNGYEKIFLCPQGAAGCFACKPYEAIIRGEAEFVGVGEYKQDLYMI